MLGTPFRPERPRKGKYADVSETSLRQGVHARQRRGSGREHIVHENRPPQADAGAGRRSKPALHVRRAPPDPRTGLTSGAAIASEYGPHFQTEGRRHTVGEVLRLVEAALASSGRTQRDRHHDARLISPHDSRDSSPRAAHPLGHQWSDRAPPPVFEGPYDLRGRPVERERRRGDDELGWPGTADRASAPTARAKSETTATPAAGRRHTRQASDAEPADGWGFGSDRPAAHDAGDR